MSVADASDAVSLSINDQGSSVPDSVSPPTATLPAKRTHSGQQRIKAVGTKRSRPLSVPSTPRKSVSELITTGAFYTRATLRKLGVAESLVDPETDTGVSVGDRVKVLSLDKAWYKAVVLSVAGGKALVHYPGWEHRFNEWVGLGSRRLQAGAVSDLEEFDLESAIQEALGKDEPLAPADEGPDGVDDVDDDDDVDEAVDLPRPRGRPTGSRNRRRVGHIKKRIRKAPPEKEPIAVAPEPTPTVEAPPVAAEYRIAKARTLSSQSSNPYAKQLLATQSFASDSDDTETPPRNEVWQLVRGPYVTTGAFLTRRTIKCLAHNESTGGIIQDHHGVYPGQMVEVMNANRSWYKARVISYADKKFLVHFVDWDHSHDEWVAAGSKRLRKALGDESEEEARRICAVLVDQYNAYVESVEKAREESEAKKLVKRRVPVKPTVVPVNAQQASLAGKAIAHVEEEEEEEIDEDVDPISVDSGFTPVPQLLRVKDYVQIYRRGMIVAARDRNKVWWKAEIIDIRTFRFRIHYIGFPKVWDEWMEMNTQRVMLADKQPTPPPPAVEEEAVPKSAPLSLRLALKALEEESPAANNDLDVFSLPKEHMSIKDYGMFLKAGDLVSIRDRDKQWYPCTIIDVKHGRIRICFNGHPEEYNQWVAVNSDRIRVLRSTVASDGRLERLEHDAQMAQRRKREKERAQRRARHGGPSVASLVRVAENLEHISEACADDQPLMYRLATGEADGLPLVTRLLAEGAQDSATWFVYCNQCRVVIRTFRYFCVACERPSAGLDYESFDLCLACFARDFPRDHAHPPASFARAAVGDAEGIVGFTAGVLAACRAQAGGALAGLAAAYERDAFDPEYQEASAGPAALAARGGGWGRVAAGLHGTATATAASDRGAVIGRSGCCASQPRCGFCASDEARGGFAGGRPFLSHEGRAFWAHDACARYSPEVLVTGAGVWYNVAAALRRARTMKCAACRKRGASVGCFHERCQRSYHVPCTGMAPEQLARGMVFWCPKHSAAAAAADAEPEPEPEPEPEAAAGDPLCACCGRRLGQDLMWMVCAECPPKDRQGFCVCLTCYEAPAALANHPHKKRCFRERLVAAPAAPRPRPRPRPRPAPGPATPCCHYCRRRTARRWRRGYGGVVMCDACFGAAHSLHDRDLFAAPAADGDGDDLDGGPVEVVALNPFGHAPGALVEDYAHSAYFTRDACTASSLAPLGPLPSYAPTDSMLFTLIVDSTYFDIPGRAPRWASHSGSDYHGTWLPQTVRRALLRYTRRGDRVLSNFLGRGTDAIECFLLSRKCVGVDINPSAVALAQRNCSFPIASSMSVEFRPAIMHGDARALCDDAWPGAAYFADPESFDHVLSHPPYKDCVLYSTNIDGDLSRFPGPDEFRREMEKVIATSWRLLRMDRYLTLGIGDNRAECFYIPVSFQLIRSYIAYGFVLDELIVKRQRYCQAFGLGTYLCVQFDFLMFTHEFIATLRKIPRHKVDLMYLPDHCYEERSDSEDEVDDGGVAYERVLREVPPSPIERKSVVMGSVWTFDRHHRYTFPQLCMSRMVERFGRDNSNWEHVDLLLTSNEPAAAAAAALLSSDSDSDDSASSVEFQDNGTRAGDYERRRQRQIQQNRAQLLHLGLVSELGEDSSDTAHYLKLLAMPPRTSAVLSLIVVPHIPNSQFLCHHIDAYRRALVQITHDASRRLCPAGLLVLGTQDIRDENGKLWPLGMLVLEDVQRAVGAIRLRLKEFIVVVEHGHARKRDDVESRDKYVEEKCFLDHPEHLPIVHAYYMVFMKLK
ncbi:hypothetical protein GGH94_000196 [Coemansia aciculifera]|uniref:PHD-type domain-containing protein n=1 Tax=Coemansia aciculifera TaxID=417176 RepID=A0A9W8IPY4_9FUNG|nr:hypothetical protein GGH94_000196 [Coemansia aciculifera]